MIESLSQDMRYAGRTFVRAAGFVIVAVLTIAIGVGANAAIFSVLFVRSPLEGWVSKAL